MSESVAVSDVVRNKALAAGAGWWLDTLPHFVAELAGEWSLRIGEPFAGSTESYVCEVWTADETPAVLKLLVPRGEQALREIEVLRVADGEGCATLYRHDAARGAMLIERLGRPLSELGMPIGERHRVLCRAAQQMWRHAPHVDLPDGAAKGRSLIEMIVSTWDELDKPCTEAAVDHAVGCAERRIAAHDDERAVLAHGDVHQWNALQAGDSFKLVDPDGLRIEPEYDLGVLMREDPVDLMRGDPWDRAHRLAQLTGCDATATWEWGVVERVSTGLLCTKIDLQPVGRQMLETADLVARI